MSPYWIIIPFTLSILWLALGYFAGKSKILKENTLESRGATFSSIFKGLRFPIILAYNAFSFSIAMSVSLCILWIALDKDSPLSLLSVILLLLCSFIFCAASNFAMAISLNSLLRKSSQCILGNSNAWVKLIDVIYYPSTLLTIAITLIAFKGEVSESLSLKITGSIAVYLVSLKFVKPWLESLPLFNRLEKNKIMFYGEGL